MVTINMAVTVDTVEELMEALKNAGPNVASFYGEVRGLNRSDAACAIRDVASKPTQPETAEDTPPAEPTPVYEMTDVRAALAKLREVVGSDGMRAVMSKHGSEKLADIDPSTYPALMADVEAALKDNAC